MFKGFFFIKHRLGGAFKSLFGGFQKERTTGGVGLETEVLGLQTSPPTGPEGQSLLCTNASLTRATPSVAPVSQTFFCKT